MRHVVLSQRSVGDVRPHWPAPRRPAFELATSTSAIAPFAPRWRSNAARPHHTVRRPAHLRSRGTGEERDIDRFDDYYLHLFLWNREKREIVGARGDRRASFRLLCGTRSPVRLFHGHHQRCVIPTQFRRRPPRRFGTALGAVPENQQLVARPSWHSVCYPNPESVKY